jgi:hypothetical protein
VQPGHGVVVCFLRGSTVNVERIRCRIRTEAKDEAVGNGAKAAKKVNNEGYQKGVTFVQCTNYHFTIYKVLVVLMLGPQNFTCSAF